MSIKKSSILVIAIIFVVSMFQLTSGGGGNTMQLDMKAETLSFSGIDEFRYEVAYADITSAELIEVDNWDTYGGHEFGHYRVGDVSDANGQSYVLFVTTRADNAVVAQQADGKQVIFNYNTTGNTIEIYKMLLSNIG